MPSTFDFNEYFRNSGAPAEAAENVRKLRSAYASFGKLIEKDGQRIIDRLNAVKAASLELSEKLPQLKFANKEDEKNLQALAQLMRSLEQEGKQLKAQETERAKAQKQLAESTGFYTKELREQKKAFKDAYNSGDQQAMQTAAKNIQALGQEAGALNRVMRGAVSSFTAAAGSYDAASQKLITLRAELRALEGGLEATSPRARQLQTEIQELDSKLKAADRAMGQGYRSVGLYADGILEAIERLKQEKGALETAAASLRAYAKSADLTADEQAKLSREIASTDEALNRNKRQLNGYGVGVASFGDQVKGNLGGLAQSFAGAYYGIQGVAVAAQQVFTNLVEYSDLASDVRKNTGMTADEFNDLADALKALPSRTPLDELLKQAIEGGKLGKTKDEILGFVRSTDIAVQALQDDFEGGAEQIATVLGKIEAGFRKSLGPDQEKNLLNIGSAINEMAASGIASSPYLAEVAQRVTATAKSANLGLAPVLAYASVLEEAGFAAEVSGTSLNRLFNTLSTKREESFNIAKLADSNLTLEKFTNLINTDFEGAVNLFLAGLRKGGTTTTKFNDLLATLKLQSGDAKNVITLLAKSQGELAKQQGIANEQLANGTSLAKEADEKNRNLAGSVEKLKKVVVGAFSDGVLAEAVKAFVDEVRYELEDVVGLLNRIGAGIGFIGEKLNLVKPKQKDFAAEMGTTTKGLYAQATAGEKLLAEYNKLAGQQSRTAQESSRLQVITSELQTTLGSNVAVVNKETGAIELSTTAVQKAIDSRRKLAGEQVKSLESVVKGTQAAIAQTQKFIGGASEQVGRAKINRDNSKLNADDRAELAALIEKRENLRRIFNSKTVEIDFFPFKRKDVDAAQAVIDAEKNLAAQHEKLKKQQGDLANAQAALDAARKAGVVVAQEQQKTGDDAGAALEDEKRKTADLTKEQYELKKARLEARIAGLERQGENVANSEEVRTRALKKAAETRIDLAALTRDELIRVAKNEANELMAQDGLTADERVAIEKTFLTKRTRLTEAFSKEELDINRDSDKELVALHNAFLDKAGAIDIQIAQNQIAALERIADDENRSAQERQTAALNAAQKRLEIVELEGAAMIRAAAGDAQELIRIQKELEGKRTEVLKTATRGTDFKLNDLDKQNLENLISLERERTSKRAEGARYEFEYQDELFNLEQDRLKKRLAELQKDPERVREAREWELEIERNANERSLEQEKQKAQRREQIIQASFQTIGAISDAYFSRNQDKLQREQDILRHNYDFQLEQAGDNEKLKEQITEEYRKKELANRRKQAKLDKQQALFNIALHTGEALVSVLSTGAGTYYADGGILAAIVSGTILLQAAAQAAAVASKPLPEFWRGTDNAPEGPAWVAERGPELIERKRGGFEYVAEKGIAYLQAGDKVLTAERTAQKLTEAALQADQLRSGPVSALNSFEAAAANVGGPPVVVVNQAGGIGEQALEQQTQRLERAMRRNALETANELLRPRFANGGNSLSDKIEDRRRRFGR